MNADEHRRDEPNSNALTPHRRGYPGYPGYPGYASQPSGPEGGQWQINATLVVGALRRWWPIALPVALMLAAGINAFLWLTFEPQYKAFTRVRFKARPEAVLGQWRSGAEADEFVANQMAILTSDMVLEPVLKHPDIARLPEIQQASDPVAYLAGGLDVSSIGRSEYYEISFTGPDPRHAALIATEVTRSYLAVYNDVEDQQVQNLVRILTQEKERRERQVERLENQLRELVAQAGVAQGELPPEVFSGDDGAVPLLLRPQAAIPRNIASLQTQRAAAEIDLLMAKERLRSFQEQMENTPIEVPEEVIEAQLMKHPSVAAQMARIAAAKTQLAEVQNRVTEKDPAKNPVLRRYAEAVAHEEKLLEDVKNSVREMVVEELKQQEAQRREDMLRSLQAQVDNLTLTLDVLTKKAEEEVAAIKHLTSQTLMDIEFTRLELYYARTTLQTINSRLTAIDVERNAPSRVEAILAEARVPNKPIAIAPVKPMAVGTAASLALPFILAILWEIRVRRIDNAGELEKAAQMPVVAEVAHLPVRVRHGAGANGAKRDLWLFEESVDTLRTCLSLSAAATDLQVVVVSSAASREGKTSVAAQLAISVARATGEMTLLIDADMRSPDQHSVFDIEREPGLVDVLHGRARLDEAVDTSWSHNLHVLPAGKLDTSPHKLIVRGGAMQKLLDEARQTYRYIIIDTPPLLAASESLVIARYGDATLLCTMRERSRVYQVRLACRRLQEVGAKLAGVVLNGVPTRRYAYQYGRYAYRQ